MYRRVFLDEAMDELLAAGKIRYHSSEHQILRKAASEGAASLTLGERTLFDQKLLPMIETIDWSGPPPPAIRRLAINP